MPLAKFIEALAAAAAAAAAAWEDAAASAAALLAELALLWASEVFATANPVSPTAPAPAPIATTLKIEVGGRPGPPRADGGPGGVDPPACLTSPNFPKSGDGVSPALVRFKSSPI